MENKIVVYGKCSGVATIATFLGNQWWVTNKDERLEPLYGDSTYDQSDYRYLCEKDELIQVKNLAGMMGCALMCGDENAKEILKSRFKDINALGVKFQAMPQVMNLKVRVLENKGTYRVWCDDSDTEWMRLFDLDGFDDAVTALGWAKAYIEFFARHGVSVRTVLKCSEDMLELLAGETQNMKIEIDEL